MCYYAHILRISPRLVPLYTERIHSPSSNSTKSSVASGEHELITELRPDDLPRINAVPQGAQTGWRWSGKMDMATEYHAGIRQAPHKYHLSIMQISIEKCTLRTPCVPSTPEILMRGKVSPQRCCHSKLVSPTKWPPLYSLSHLQVEQNRHIPFNSCKVTIQN